MLSVRWCTQSSIWINSSKNILWIGTSIDFFHCFGNRRSDSSLLLLFQNNLPNKINEVDVAAVNGLLIKKILEYRQVRNYNREEENSLKANVETINKKVTEFRCKIYNMMDNIIQKQDKLIQFYENIEYDSQASDIMVINRKLKNKRIFFL